MCIFEFSGCLLGIGERGLKIQVQGLSVSACLCASVGTQYVSAGIQCDNVGTQCDTVGIPV